MSKGKKRHPTPTPSARSRSEGATLADDKRQYSKRFKPVARNLLFLDLIFLAISQYLYSKQYISDMLSGFITLVGLALLLIALWIQFGSKEGKGGGSSGGWPLLK